MTRLREMTSESVHMCWVSPPYWGLRSYGTEPQIWGGDADCAHEWGEEQRTAWANAVSGPSNRGKNGDDYRQETKTTGPFCQLCGAWCGEHGLEPSFGLWLQHEVEIFSEVHRVLRNDGTLWLNIGDAYATAPNGRSAAAGAIHGRDDRTFRDKPFTTVGGVFKSKDRLMMPARLAIALQETGWYLRDEIIWRKPNPMPCSVDDRTTPAHEMMYLFSKVGRATFWWHRDGRGARKQPKPDYRWIDAKTGEERATEPRRWKSAKHDGKPRWQRINLWTGDDYFYDQFAIKEPVSDNTHARISHSALTNFADATRSGPNSRLRHDANGTPRPRKKVGGWATGSDHSAISHASHESGWKSPGVNPKADQPRDIGGKQNASFVAATSAALVADRNKRSVWDIVLEPFKGAHFATAPTKLVEPCVLAGTSEKGVCPHCGAPWVRQIGKGRPLDEWRRACGGDTDGEYHGQATKDYESARAQNASDVKRRILEGMVEDVHLGWSPTCGCDDNEPVSATVLDPFGGAGTTGLVAARFRRHAILIELNPDYARIAAARLRGDLQDVVGVEHERPTNLPLFAAE